MGKSKIVFTEPSLTVQSAAGDLDINTMVARARATGQWMNTQAKPGRYLDCTKVNGYQDAIEKVREAEDVFKQLPAAVRDRFGNQPLKMVEFVLDPANRDEGERLGLLKPKPKPEEPKK